MTTRFGTWTRGIFGQGPRRTNPSDFDPNTGEFTLPDPDDLADELRIREKARRDAESGLPSPDSTEPTGNEHSIISHCQGRATENYSAAVRQIAGYEAAIVNADVRIEQREIENIPKAFRAQADALLQQRKKGLELLRQELKKAERDYEDFREENRLNREPDYPESYFLRIAVLTLAVVFETVLNAYFFASGDEFGLAGGGIRAFLLAMVDIVIVWQVAQFATKINARSRFQKVLGVLALIFVTGWLIGYNLGVAHYRESMTKETIEGAELAFATFRANPFGLQHGDSWLFFALGAIFTLSAIIDGLGWDDSYPGFGKRHRRIVRLEDDIKDSMENIVSETSVMRDEHKKSLDELVNKARSTIDTLRVRIGHLKALLRRSKTYVESWESIANTLVSRFRSENERYRTTPVPSYFGRPVSIPVIERHAVDGEGHQQLLSQQTKYLDRVVTQRAPTLIAIDIEFTRFVEGLHQLETR